MGLYTGRGDIPHPKHYYTKIRDMRPANLLGYWPQWEGGGAVSYDQSGNGRDGAYVGVTLGSPGIGDGQVCPFFDGVNDYDDIFTVGLQGAFNGAEGTIMMWGRVANVGVWTDGAIRHEIRTFVDAANDIYMRKRAPNNQFIFSYEAGGVVRSRTLLGMVTTDWFSCALTWSAAADEVRAYLDGVQQGATLNGLGVWAGVLLANNTTIGASDAVPNQAWHGYLAHSAVWDTPLTPAEIAFLARVE